MCIVTVCNNDDIFGAGSGSLSITQPYTNVDGYMLVNYDLKPVTQRESLALNDIDFSGPMHENIINDNETSVIDQNDVNSNTGGTSSVNPSLRYNEATGYLPCFFFRNNTLPDTSFYFVSNLFLRSFLNQFSILHNQDTVCNIIYIRYNMCRQ